MTLRSQLAIAVSTLLFLIFILLAVFDARQSRDYLDYQLSRTAQDTANSLSLSVQSAWQDEPDVAILTSQVDALFTQGLYQEVLIQDNAGKALVQRANSHNTPEVPEWFESLYALSPAAASAEISDGWRIMGSVSVTPHPGLAYQNLWGRFQQVAVGLVLGGSLAIVLVFSLIGRLLAPLERIRRQTDSWAVGDFNSLPQTEIVEVQPLIESHNRTNAALSGLITGLQDDLELARRTNELDAVSGLLNREAFIRQIESVLQGDEAALGAMVMVRLKSLNELNESIGRALVDEFIVNLSHAMSDMTPRAQVLGRMNGSDWSLMVPGLDEEQASEYCGRIRWLCEKLAPMQEELIQVVATPVRTGMPLSDILGRLDRGLMEGAKDAWVSEQKQMRGGRTNWSRHVSEVFGPTHLSFRSMVVVDREKQPIYDLLLTQLSDPEGEPIGVPSFIPVLAKLDRLSELDELAVQEVCRRAQQRPQGVTLSADAIQHPDRLERYVRLIGDQAANITIELSEADLVAAKPMWGTLERILRTYPSWVLKHAGLHSETLDLVRRFAPTAVKLDNALIRTSMNQGAEKSVVRTTSHLLHSLQCKVLAEGISESNTWDWVMLQGLDGGQGLFLFEDPV